MSRFRRTIAILVLVGLVLSTAGTGVALAQEETECTFPYSVTDATGEEITVEDSPDDIVVMHPNAAQIAHEIGVWDRVVGAPVTPFTAYLEDYDEPRSVTDEVGTPDLEVIIDLDPDLVLAGHVADQEALETLRDEGITVYMEPEPASVDDIATNVETYGQLTGACEGAADTTDWMDTRLEEAESIAEDLDDPVIYYEMGDGWTTGQGTYQDDMITLAGGENLAALADVEGWEPISAEQVVAHDPDWIIYGDTAEEPPVAEGIEETTAMQENQTIAVDSNYIGQAGPRVVLVIEEIASEIAAETETNASDAEDASDDGIPIPVPAFGVPAALLAALLGALLHRFR